MTAPGSPETPPEGFDAGGEGQTPADTASALLTTIWPLLGRHIAFHRRLVDLTGNVKAALLLSQAVYWTRHGRDIAQRDGWFHKTAEQWELELGPVCPRADECPRVAVRPCPARRAAPRPARPDALSPQPRGARSSACRTGWTAGF